MKTTVAIPFLLIIMLILFSSSSKSACAHDLLSTLESVVVRDFVTVNPNGTGNFTKINDAIAASPAETKINDGYFVIYVIAGIYEEYVMIPKSKQNLMMIGDGINRTIITGNRCVEDGQSTTTLNSSTFAVLGNGFVGINLTIVNTAGRTKAQAVAVLNEADLSVFYRCSFEAYQDTLYARLNKQFYRECHIYGTIDFIFGDATAVFQNCSIYARLPGPGNSNVLTAHGRTRANDHTGFSLHRCQIVAAPELATSNQTVKTFLGRPWKRYSRTIFMQSFIDSVIDPLGWNPWNGDFLTTLSYGEFANTGPGSNTSGRVNWPGFRIINSTAEAEQFTVRNFISGDDWLHLTGVPYMGGLFSD